MVFCNNAAVHSRRRHLVLRLLARATASTAGRPTWSRTPRTGRLLRRVADGAVEVVLDGLRFANGVALAADESLRRGRRDRRPDRRTALADRPTAGERDLLADDLPGYPDNIGLGSDGLVWVTIASPTDPVLERLMHRPAPLRRLAWRLPERLQPRPKRTVRVLALADDGRVVHDLLADASGYHLVDRRPGAPGPGVARQPGGARRRRPRRAG